MGSEIFNIDYSIASERLLSPDKRTPKMLAWLSALALPLQQKHDEIFTVYMPDVLQRTHWNGQTIVLEAVLDKLLGITGTYIESNNNPNNVFFIGTKEDPDTSYITIPGEEEDYIGLVNDLNIYDFTVYLPAVDFNDENIRRTTSIVKKYKLYGTTFNILSL